MVIEVLVVDDDSFDRRILRRALKSDDRFAKTLEATCAEDGLEIAKTLSQRSIVITDLRMPIVDGLAFISLLKADARTRGLPVLAMSSSNAEKDRHAAIEAGAAGFAAKPAGKAEFAALVSKMASLAGVPLAKSTDGATVLGAADGAAS